MRIGFLHIILFLVLLFVFPSSVSAVFVPYDEYSVIDRENNVIKTYMTPVNYQDGDGVWASISNSLETLVPGDVGYEYGYRYGQDDGLLGVYAKPSITSQWPLAVNISGFAVQYEPVSVGYVDWVSKEYRVLQDVQSSTVIVEGNTITYPGVFYDTNLTRRLDSWRWKEEIIMGEDTKSWMANNPPSSFGLSNADSYLVFYFRMKLTNLNPYYLGGEQGGTFEVMDGPMEFRDSSGDLKWFLPLDDAYELGNESNRASIRYRVVGSGSMRSLYFGVKVSELSAMSFPVVFDPTDTTATNNADTWVRENDPTSNKGGLSTMEAGFPSGDQRIMLVNFTLPADPGGVVISRVELIMFKISASSPLPRNYSVRNTIEGWIEDEVSWDNRTSLVPWTTPGGLFPGSANATPIVNYTTNISDRIFDTIPLLGDGVLNPQTIDWTDELPLVIHPVLGECSLCFNSTESSSSRTIYVTKENGSAEVIPFISITFTAGEPTFTIESPTNDTFSAAVWFNVTNIVFNDGDGNVTAQLDGVQNFTLTNSSGNWNFLNSSMSEGSHSVQFFVNNSDGVMNNTETVFFTVDSVSPVVVIDLPLNITHATDTLEVNATFTDDNPDVIFFSLDGGSNSTPVSRPLNDTIVGLSDGSHNVRVCANDTLGNMGCLTRFFTIEAGISIVTPTNSTFLTPIVLLSVVSNASVVQWNFSLDGGPSTAFTPNITLLLSNGSHNIVVFANLTASGVIRNTTVFFTLNYTISNITFLPPTPNNGTVIEAFDPFTIQANISVGGSQPIVFFLRNGVSFGSFDLVFREGSTSESIYWMTLDTLTRGNYTYFAQTIIDGTSFISGFRELFIISPLFRESDGSTVFPSEFILVSYLSPPSPLSHDAVPSDGFRVEARAFNINGVVLSAIVEFLSPGGAVVGSNVLSFSDASNNTWLLFGDVVPGSNFTTLSYRILVNDSSGRFGSSLDRLITVNVVGGGDIDIAGALGTIEGTLGVSRGSPERNFGRVILSFGAIGIMVSSAFGTPLGLTGALPLGVTGIILMARSGDIPVYLGVLGVLLTAGIGVKLFLDMMPSSGEKL